MSITYLYTDGLKRLVPRTDTLKMCYEVDIRQAAEAEAGSEGKGTEEREKKKKKLKGR